MKLLANENFPFKSVTYLRSKGFDVLAVGTDYPGIKDSDIMIIAIKEERTILTFDKDYGELIFKFNYRPKKGVIYIRLDHYEPIAPGKFIEELIVKSELTFENALTVVSTNGVRQRKFDN
jgi:predicted nuclease of predicted toxin-antitoxin system